MFIEKRFFLLIDQIHDVIVVSHNEHDIFLENTKLLTAMIELGQVDVQVDEAVLCHLGPILNLNQYLAQFGVKVALKQADFARILEDI